MVVGEEDDAVEKIEIPGGRKFWKSASWSASRSQPQGPAVFDYVKECAEKNGGPLRRSPVPLTPRSQQNCKARACLPPLQPLSIARRSLDDLVYKTLWLQDSPSEDITSILYDVFDYFEDVREQGGRVFVHCCQGVSRSTSLVIAYLMWREGQSFDDAFQFVKAARRIANPNMGFTCQLLQCQKRVHAIPLSPSSVLRMYRMAPHSPYDPLHLVPKMLNDPSPSALDSRGAFIIHVPSAIYVWIGKRCEPIMERDTKGAAYQVVRYERVQGPIVTVEEGEESLEFWDAFCNLVPSVNKSNNGAQVCNDQLGSVVKNGPGERQVDLYNVDYELFQKATAGGFVPPFSSSEAGEETLLPVRESNWSVLRRRFASGKMKEFVSASKVSLCRNYSDSVLITDTDSRLQKLLPLLADSPTLSSPSYHSPNSVSSDSSPSSKFSSESPSQSPSSSCSLTPSPASSTSSDLLHVSTNNSNHNICNSPRVASVGQSPKSGSQSVLSPSERFALSLAERRGSLSPSLNLPCSKDAASFSSRRLKSAFAGSLVRLQDGLGRNSHPRSLDKACNNEEITQIKKGFSSEVGDAIQGRHMQSGWELSVKAESIGKGSKIRGTVQPSVFCWPNLEKIETFAVGNLDSKSAFLFLAPSVGVSKDTIRLPYLWIGKFFKHDDVQIQLYDKIDVAEVEQVDWNQAGPDFHSLMDLPKDATIKVVKEEEEPVEFLDLLYSL